MNTPPLQLHIYKLPWTHWKWVQWSTTHFLKSSLTHTSFKRAEESNPLEDSFLSIYTLEGILTKKPLADKLNHFSEIREETTNIHFKVLTF